VLTKGIITNVRGRRGRVMSGKATDTTFRVAGMIGLALLLGLVLWAQRESRPHAHEGGHDHADPTQHGHDAAGKPLEAAHAKAMAPSGSVENGVRVVEYDAFQYNFAPDPLVVRAGEEVRLMVKSRDVAHGAMIPEVDFSTDIPTDRRKPADFTAPAQPGEYPVFCSVFCGPRHGDMRGRLVVLPAEQEEGHHDE
jgi:cytochrome c oxidase subunit 2